MLRHSIVNGFVSACVLASLAACSGQKDSGSTVRDYSADAQSKTGDNFQATIYNQTAYTVSLSVYTDDGQAKTVDLAPGGNYKTFKYDIPYETNASANDSSLANANIQEDAVHLKGTVKGMSGTFKAMPWLDAKDLQDAQSGSNNGFGLDDRVATLPVAGAPAAGAGVAFDQRFAVHKVASNITDANGDTHEGAWAAGIKVANGVVTVVSMAGGTGKVGGTNQCTGSTDVQFAHVQGKGELGGDRGCGDFQ